MLIWTEISLKFVSDSQIVYTSSGDGLVLSGYMDDIWYYIASLGASGIVSPQN